MSTEDACTLPAGPDNSEFEIVRRLLNSQRIAVVGLSDDPSKASYRVAEYLKKMGKTIIPINPNHRSVFGIRCHASLQEVTEPIDLVDIFRRPEFCPDVVRAAIQKGVKGIWLQSGIRSEESRRLAREAGVDYIEDRCLMVEHSAAL